MKIAIVGATGRTGRHVLTKALESGHEVIVLARNPDAIAVRHERLRVERGDVLDRSSIDAALSGVDAVISTIASADPRKPGTLISQGIENIVLSAEKAGVKMIIFESSLMMTTGNDLSLVSRTLVAIARSLTRAFYVEYLAAEKVIQRSSLDWVIVRAPALVQEPASESYICGPSARINLIKPLSYQDAADCLVRALVETSWTGKIVNVGH